ncbi:unnamed protein product [Prorocentrum cordatum]|nr:unnamed protein product [Polarella glacialis]
MRPARREGYAAARRDACRTHDRPVRAGASLRFPWISEGASLLGRGGRAARSRARAHCGGGYGASQATSTSPQLHRLQRLRGGVAAGRPINDGPSSCAGPPAAPRRAACQREAAGRVAAGGLGDGRMGCRSSAASAGRGARAPAQHEVPEDASHRSAAVAPAVGRRRQVEPRERREGIGLDPLGLRGAPLLHGGPDVDRLWHCRRAHSASPPPGEPDVRTPPAPMVM